MGIVSFRKATRMVADLEAIHDCTSGDSGSAIGACAVLEGGE